MDKILLHDCPFCGGQHEVKFNDTGKASYYCRQIHSNVVAPRYDRR